MNIDNKIRAFIVLGEFLSQFGIKSAKNQNVHQVNELFFDPFNELICSITIKNPWFTEDNCRNAIGAIANSLSKENFVKFVCAYIYYLKKMRNFKMFCFIIVRK